MSKLVLVFPAAAIIFILFWFADAAPCLRRRQDGLLPTSGGELMPPCAPARHSMQQKDILPLALITAVYAAVAFFGLGDTAAPQSFCHFADSGSYAQLQLPAGTEVSSVMYYTGLNTGKYYLQFSADGETWVDAAVIDQNYAALFKWNYVDFDGGDGEQTAAPEQFRRARHLRLISDGELYLGELALYDGDGQLLPSDSLGFFSGGCRQLFDEQELVPDRPSYLNSSYFDEIYHARTAYEHIQGVYPYEISHPPLGKLIIALGIELFGMTPFGWRFSGTLTGVLMLPALYIFLKRLFGSTAVSSCGTAIFAFDFMHYVQTRIATIDTYAVFFTILMYMFMYMYIAAERDWPSAQKRRWLWLFLSGLSFGVGAACKWTVLYGGAGLAVLWLGFWILRMRELIRCGHARRARREFFGSAGACTVFFVLIPAVIYYVSYYPYGAARGGGGISMFFTSDYARTVLDNQKYMFTYHAGVNATHPYSSHWWQWVLDIRPILYYLEYFDDGTKSAFGAFVNPLLCWGGLPAMLSMLYLAVFGRDRKAAFILVGYLAQLVPWMFISRIVFEYHYFPSTVFLVLALCHVFDAVRHGSKRWKRMVYGYTALTVCLFAAFYPVLSGLRVPRTYTDLLRWIPGSWPF